MSDEDWWECHEAESPENKMELIEGQLVIGNSLRGTRYLLWDILHSYGADAAFFMSTEDMWRKALAQGFRHLWPPRPGAPIEDWRAWAEGVEYEPLIDPSGPEQTDRHWSTRDCVRWALYNVVNQNGLGQERGPDSVMLLGENAFTPDHFVYTPEHRDRAFNYYFAGAPNLVIEILITGHEAQDAEVKRRYYEEAGVPEYWMIDPQKQELVVLRLVAEGYQPVQPDDDGRFRSESVPGLVLVVDERLWRSHQLDNHPFEAEGKGDFDGWKRSRERKAAPGIEYGHLDFAPRIGLEPVPIRFDEFISWCPRAKFERYGGGPVIGGGRDATRKVLGMLLSTLGLIDTVTVLHPQVWVAGMIDFYDEDRRARKKEAWWELARRAAAIVREKHSPRRLALAGDLVRSRPLDAWSDIEILSWGLGENRSSEIWNEIREVLGHDPRIYVFDTETMRAWELEEYEADPMADL